LTEDPKLVDNLAADHQRAGLSDAEVAMLDYAVKLTLRPWEMEKEDVLALRRAGFDDTAILDINQVTGYFAYVNRLADGLGVALESIWDNPVEGSEGDQAP
jgi:uncharacterized peroxidase-related enzyme